MQISNRFDIMYCIMIDYDHSITIQNNDNIFYENQNDILFRKNPRIL